MDVDDGAPAERVVKLVGGVDAGGSHTEAVIGNISGAEIGRSRGGPANARTANGGAAAQTIAETVREAGAGAGAGASTTPLAVLVIGAAGAGLDTPRNALRKACLATGVADEVHVTTDAAIALESAFSSGPGMLLAAGTGSIAYARDASGNVERVGGHGSEFGDEGSGYDIGRSAIKAVLRAQENRGEPTEITAALCDMVGGTDKAELAEWMQQANPADVADLARLVCAEAVRGDQLAKKLVNDAVQELATHVAALMPHLQELEAVELALAGGLLRSGSPIREALVEHLTQLYPTLRVRVNELDPARAAMLMAANLAH